jgi:hypothetical protein
MVNTIAIGCFTPPAYSSRCLGGTRPLPMTKRRQRRADPLASAPAVERLLEELRTSLPDLIPRSRKNLVALLNSVRGLYARPASDTKRGRPGRFRREDLLRVDSRLRDLLGRETSISVRSFVGQYLPILGFPADVREPLERGEINLFEAHQLARLTGKRLGSTEAEARSHRRRFLESHLAKQEPGSRLRLRVMEALGELREPDPVQTEMVAVGKADELLEADPLDASHLFFEELRMIGRALREVSPEEVTDEDLAEIMPAVDQITLTLQRIVRRRERGREQARRLRI